MVHNTGNAYADGPHQPAAASGPHPHLEVIRGALEAPPPNHNSHSAHSHTSYSRHLSTPGTALPPLRVLRPPLTEPDYDPPGAVVIPFPDRRTPPPPARHLRLVRPPVTEPDPAEARRRVLRFALLLSEALSGRRPFRQLTAHTTADVRTRVNRLHHTLHQRPTATVSLASWNATAPTDTAAEGFLRLRVAPDRFQAVALRLDRLHRPTRPHDPPTWICTALQYA